MERGLLLFDVHSYSPRKGDLRSCFRWDGCGQNRRWFLSNRLCAAGIRSFFCSRRRFHNAQYCFGLLWRPGGCQPGTICHGSDLPTSGLLLLPEGDLHPIPHLQRKSSGQIGIGPPNALQPDGAVMEYSPIIRKMDRMVGDKTWFYGRTQFFDVIFGKIPLFFGQRVLQQ